MNYFGIDFGSSNSVVSAYRNGKPETVLLGTNSPVVPSLVARKNETVRSGVAARNAASQTGFTVYKAFKMLLPFSDSLRIRERGYSEKYTPAAVAKKYLSDLVRRALDHYQESEIDNLVVGAPEIWFNRIDTLSGRNVLKRICEMDCVRSVQIVSEPAAASAFFSYNYEQITGCPFQGYILLVDYGGGTLDISLSKVSTCRIENGRQLMEINVEDRQGAGENKDRKIGNAGICYLEELTEAALRKAGLLREDEEPVLDNAFYSAVNFLEDEIRSRVTEIDSSFKEMEIKPDARQEKEFTSFSYKNGEAEVSYALMEEVYDRLIRPSFQENLERSIQYMKNSGICYQDTNCTDFKIALVGGFGNFYLVRRQLDDMFCRSGNDKRFEGIIKNRDDCENAVSLGTALISAGIIGIRHTAPYSVGLFQKNPDGSQRIDYAIRYRQDILEVTDPEDDRDKGLYYCRKKNGDIRRIMIVGNAIRELMINYGTDDGDALPLPLKKEFQEELTGLVENRQHLAAIAFSMDRSDVLSIHIGEYEMGMDRPGKMRCRELADFSELFDTEKIKQEQGLKEQRQTEERFRDEVREMQKKIADSQKTVMHLKGTAIPELSIQLEEYAKEENRLYARKEELTEKLKEQEDRVFVLRREMEDQEASLNAAEVTLESEKKHLDVLKNQLIHAIDAENANAAEMEKVKEDIRKYEELMAHEKQETKKLQETVLPDRQREELQTKERLALLRKQKQELDNFIESEKEICCQLEQQRTDQENQLQKKCQEKEKFLETVRKNEAALQQMERDKEQLTDKVAGQEHRKRELEQEVQKSQKDYERLQEEQCMMEDSLKEMKTQFQLLQTKSQGIAGLIEELWRRVEKDPAVLKTLQGEDKTNGKYGVVQKCHEELREDIIRFQEAYRSLMNYLDEQ